MIKRRFRKFEDLCGKRLGSRVVLWQFLCVFTKHGRTLKYKTICDCGKIQVLGADAIKSGDACCGMIKSNIRRATHKKTNTAIYRTWAAMKERCYNPKNSRFKDYGGRGIKVCERWMDSSRFFADMGERPNGTTLDRIDVNGNYEPGNCRWQTPWQQSNNRRNSRKYTISGESKTLSEWHSTYGSGDRTKWSDRCRGLINRGKDPIKVITGRL
jgi:hypothetical protein